jgi:hypothetical protein
VVRACVPETAIDERGYTCAGECNVWAPRQLWVIDPGSQSTAVQFFANQDLRPGRCAGHPLHLSRNHWVKWRWATLRVHWCQFVLWWSAGSQVCAPMTDVILRPPPYATWRDAGETPGSRSRASSLADLRLMMPWMLMSRGPVACAPPQHRESRLWQGQTAPAGGLGRCRRLGQVKSPSVSGRGDV